MLARYSCFLLTSTWLSLFSLDSRRTWVSFRSLLSVDSRNTSVTFQSRFSPFAFAALFSLAKFWFRKPCFLSLCYMLRLIPQCPEFVFDSCYASIFWAFTYISQSLRICFSSHWLLTLFWFKGGPVYWWSCCWRQIKGGKVLMQMWM